MEIRRFAVGVSGLWDGLLVTGSKNRRASANNVALSKFLRFVMNS